MFSRLFRRFGRATHDQLNPCPFCESDLLAQAKYLLASGYYIGAIASARCFVSRRLLIACGDLELFTSGKQKKRPNLPGMVWRLAQAGAIDPDTLERFNAFGKSTAAILEGGPRLGASRAWKAISAASVLTRELNNQLHKYRQDELLAAQDDDEPKQPDSSATL